MANLIPILCGDYPDPSLVRVGGDYYLTHSTFVYAPSLLIWHSQDLLTWRPVVSALPVGDGDIWAPDLPVATPSLSDDFSRPDLGWQWRFFHGTNAGRCEIEDASLRLYGRGESIAPAAIRFAAFRKTRVTKWMWKLTEMPLPPWSYGMTSAA
jgi:hypothetical protein